MEGLLDRILKKGQIQEFWTCFAKYHVEKGVSPLIGKLITLLIEESLKIINNHGI